MNRKTRWAARRLGAPKVGAKRDNPQRFSAANPGTPDALTSIGRMLLHDGRPQEAADYFVRALQDAPDSPALHTHLGAALATSGNLLEALDSFQTALRFDPDFTVARASISEIVAKLQDAVAHDDTPENRALLGWAVSRLRIALDLPDLRDLIARALEEHWGHTRDFISVALALLAENHAIRRAARRANEAWPRRLSERELFDGDGLTDVAGDSLLRAFLAAVPVLDVAFERFLTALRAVLLDLAEAGQARSNDLLALTCALARNCFIAEYVLDCPQGESGRASALVRRATGDAFSLAVFACYAPLGSLPEATTLARQSWPQPLAAVFAQQVSEPAQERELAKFIDHLTPIDDETSLRVREQYERNPYPRWSGVPDHADRATIDDLLRKQFPAAGFKPLGKDSVDYLIAGCGTRQAIDVAKSLPDAKILAVDLSLSSLAYAKRIATTLALQNVEFAQADIMRLPGIARRFDVIDSMGVLHHLADLWGGWSALLSVLRPAGVMRVGLYSEIARKDIRAARAYASQHGFSGESAADIRRYRQALCDLPEGEPAKRVTTLTDFFSISECRDLLLHVQEHQTTLPAVKKFIEENGLTLIGLVVPEQVRRRYAAEFPGDPAQTNLDNWHEVELANPNLFLTMYELWVQRRD